MAWLVRPKAQRRLVCLVLILACVAASAMAARTKTTARRSTQGRILSGQEAQTAAAQRRDHMLKAITKQQKQGDAVAEMDEPTQEEDRQ